MKHHDLPTTLHFVDPPYVHATRVMQQGKAGYYRHEMSNDQHDELLTALLELEGMVVLSGYRSDLYDERLASWERHETAARISAGRGTAVRTEVVWINPACRAALHGRSDGLFAKDAVA